MNDAIAATTQFPLGLAKRGYSGVIRRIDTEATGSALSAAELESRLIELGFVEGAAVELLHEGLFGGDPIAVRVAATTIALRRREAMAVMVSAESVP
jgi:ferrous iron transport protein A